MRTLLCARYITYIPYISYRDRWTYQFEFYMRVLAEKNTFYSERIWKTVRIQLGGTHISGEKESTESVDRD